MKQTVKKGQRVMHLADQFPQFRHWAVMFSAPLRLFVNSCVPNVIQKAIFVGGVGGSDVTWVALKQRRSGAGGVVCDECSDGGIRVFEAVYHSRARERRHCTGRQAGVETRSVVWPGDEV